MFNSNPAKGKKSIFLKGLLYGAVILLLLITAVQLARQSVILNRFSTESEKLIHEFRQVREGVVQYGHDLNEMREYLLLPVRDYDFFPKIDQEEEGDDLALGVYRFTDHIGKDYLLQKEQQSTYTAIKALKNDRDFLNGLKELNLLPARYMEETLDYVKFKFYENKTTPVVGLVLDRLTADFYMESILGPEPLEVVGDLGQTTLQYLKENLENIFVVRGRITEQKKTIKELWQSDEVSQILQEKRLQVSLDPSEVEKGFEYVVYNSITEPLFTFLINRKSGDIKLGDKSYADAESVKPDLLIELDKLTGETEYEKTISQNREKLNFLMSEPAFAETLKISNLDLAPEREEGGRIYFDLISTDDGSKIGSIIFNALTGDLRFWRADENREYELMDVLDFGVKKNS
jgi:hypothetical protein